MDSIKARIVERAFTLGFHQVGFGRARRFDSLGGFLEQRPRLEFEPEDVTLRIDPSRHLKNAQGMIALAWAYPLGRNDRIGKDQVKVASSLEEDYHRVMRRALEALLADVTGWLGCEGKTMVDLEGLNDRAVALACGIGYPARNGFVMSPYLGTAFNIGYLLIDQPVEEDPEDPGDCGACTRCVKACPTGALVGDGSVQAEICLSYLTQKKSLEEGEAGRIGDSVYGCDICQLACPRNRVLETTPGHVFEAEELLSMSNREFRRHYGDREFSWRGGAIIRRNIRISLKNRR